jgi:hypothetical protein
VICWDMMTGHAVGVEIARIVVVARIACGAVTAVRDLATVAARITMLAHIVELVISALISARVLLRPMKISVRIGSVSVCRI